jgi:DNA-binding beta-propeller fold protein YncE
MKKISIIVLFLTLIVSCKKNEDLKSGSFLTGDGVFLVNEGNFMGGNGTLSYYSYDSSKIYNDLFTKVNGRPLGDVPNSMEMYGNMAYIIVNNSGKIEVIKKSTLQSVTSIPGLISPRNIGFVNSSKAYVTSMYSDSLIIINLNNFSVSGYVDIRRSSESIVISDDKAFIASWVGGNDVMVISTITDEVIDSVEVGLEPESMVLDRNNMLWVLCNGGWMRENFAELDGINTQTNSIEKHIIFPTKEASPSCLRIDGSGETLYYLENGVRKMNITSLELPAAPFIPQSDNYFYKLGINPVTGDVFVTDAVDYQQNGHLLYYNSAGTLVADELTDIIPGSMCFRQVAN